MLCSKISLAPIQNVTRVNRPLNWDNQCSTLCSHLLPIFLIIKNKMGVCFGVPHGVSQKGMLWGPPKYIPTFFFITITYFAHKEETYEQPPPPPSTTYIMNNHDQLKGSGLKFTSMNEQQCFFSSFLFPPPPSSTITLLRWVYTLGGARNNQNPIWNYTMFTLKAKHYTGRFRLKNLTSSNVLVL